MTQAPLQNLFSDLQSLKQAQTPPAVCPLTTHGWPERCSPGVPSEKNQHNFQKFRTPVLRGGPGASSLAHSRGSQDPVIVIYCEQREESLVWESRGSPRRAAGLGVTDRSLHFIKGHYNSQHLSSENIS